MHLLFPVPSRPMVFYSHEMSSTYTVIFRLGEAHLQFPRWEAWLIWSHQTVYSSLPSQLAVYLAECQSIPSYLLTSWTIKRLYSWCFFSFLRLVRFATRESRLSSISWRGEKAIMDGNCNDGCNFWCDWCCQQVFIGSECASLEKNKIQKPSCSFFDSQNMRMM